MSDTLPCSCSGACQPAPWDHWTPVLIGLKLARDAVALVQPATDDERRAQFDVGTELADMIAGLEELQR